MSDLILPKKPTTLQGWQDYMKQMVIARGFSESAKNPETLFLLLNEEIGELARAIRKHQKLGFAQDTKQSELSEELADVFIYLLDIANCLNVDLEQAVRDKEEKNMKRVWK